MAEIDIILPELAPFQQEWVDASKAFRFVCIEGATGTGKTYVFEPDLFEDAHNPVNRGDEYWWVSPTIAQARAVYDNIKRSLEDAGVIGLYKCIDTLREIHTPEGGILVYRTGEDPNTLFGIRNVRRIVVDEFTRCRMSLWPALLSVANKTGCHIVLIGNYQGDDTPWHLWVNSMLSSPRFRYFKTPATHAIAAGIMPQEAFDDARRTLPEVVFNALYMCEGSSDPSLLVHFDAVADLWTNAHVPEGDPCLVCDIALHGSDRFTLSAWRGMVMVELLAFNKKTAPEVTAIIQGKAIEHGVPRSKIAFDADGLGAYLKGYLDGATPYHGGSVSMPQEGQKMSYHRLRDQCHFLAADAINARAMWLKTSAHRDEMEQEIIASLRKKGQNQAGQWMVVSKDSTDPPGAKQRLGRSPDLFDLLPIRMFLTLAPTPKFADGIQRIGERRKVKITRPPREGNINFQQR